MTLTWEAFAVLLAIIGGCQAVMLFVVRAVVRSELAKLDNIFVSTDLCRAEHGENARRLDDHLRAIERLQFGSRQATIQNDMERSRHTADQREDNRRLNALEETL